MRYILSLALAALTINSPLSAATYVTTSGVTKVLLKTNGTPHSYPGPNLEAGTDLSVNFPPSADLSNADLKYADLLGAVLKHSILYWC